MEDLQFKKYGKEMTAMKGINLASCLENSVHAHPGKVALIFEEESWTFRELDAEANRIANGLVDLGVEKGDRVSLFLPNCPEFLFWYFGALKMGAVVNPVNTMLKERELEYVVRDCTPRSWSPRRSWPRCPATSSDCRGSGSGI